MDRRELIKRMALAAGYTLTAPALASIVTACESQPELGWAPLTLSPEQAAALEEITEVLLPKTATPGAKDMKVAQSIDAFVSVVYSPEAKEQFKQDFDAFLKDCYEMHGSPFVNCSDAERKEFLKKYDTPESYGISVWGTDMAKKDVNAFFKKIKAMTVSAYFNTEELGERVLAYDPIPGTLQVCIPYEPGTKAWSL